MKISFIPSLYHLAGSRLVSSLLVRLQVSKRHLADQEKLKGEIVQSISRLTPNVRLQEKIGKFIVPLLCEIEDRLKNFTCSYFRYDAVYQTAQDAILKCWLSDGTIGDEKAIQVFVKNEDLHPLNRFIFACTFCLFEDILDLWGKLYKIEKAFLTHKAFPPVQQADLLVKHWALWLENSSDKKLDEFLAWILTTPVWCSNVHILKLALKTLSQAEKSQYLLEVLIGGENRNLIEGEIDVDIMRFCISIVTEEEQERIFRESPVEVFRCIFSWPVRSIFFDVADCLWPYLSEDSFCDILNMVLERIKKQKGTDVELLTLVKRFWAQSPCHLRSVAKDDDRFSKALQFILDFDVSQNFPEQSFTNLMEKRMVRPLSQRIFNVPPPIQNMLPLELRNANFGPHRNNRLGLIQNSMALFRVSEE